MRRVYDVLIVLVVTVLLIGLVSGKGLSLTGGSGNKPGEIDLLFKSVQIGSGISFKNMTVYPVIANNAQGDEFILLDSAIKNDTIEIKEKGESGNVNQLELQKNESKQPVFMMAGEIIKGAKQDRIISNDIILGKDSKKYTIAVYCVEQGRWTHQSAKFDSAGVAGANALRSAVVQSKSQSEVWNEVSKKSRALGASSGTSNFRATYESKAYKEGGAEYVSHFMNLAEKNPKYVGVIVKIDNKITNMDIFGDHDTFTGLWPKLLKAYSQDAVDESAIEALPKISTAQDFLNSLKNSNYKENSNPGLGNEYSIKSDKVAGSMLTYNNDVAHIALFADSSKPEPVNDHRINDYGQQIQQYNEIPNIIRPRNDR